MLLTRSFAAGFLLTGLVVAAFSGGAVAQAQSAPPAAAAPAAPEGTTDAVALLARAIALRQSGDIEGAVAAYEQILKLAPDTPRVRSNLAEAYARLGRYDEAIDQYKRELAVDPYHFEANLLLGDLLREGGQPEEALVYLTRAARLRGDDLAVQFSLGAAYVALGRTAEALPLLRVVAAAAPDHLQTHMQLAIVYHRMGQTEDEARERATMGKLQSESEKAYFQGVSRALATLFGKSSVPDSAAPLLRAMAAAESSLREGETETAESHYRSALQEGWELVGDLATVDGRLTDARDAFRAASASAVENRRALQSLVVAHLQLREAAQAVEILTRLLSKNPRDLQIRKLLAQALVANGQTSEAVQELEEAYAGAPDDDELAFTLALGYLRQKKVDLAERLFAKIVSARPIPQTHVLIGRTYRDFGEYERARVELRAALAMDSRVRRAHYHLGLLTLAQQGSDPEDAIAEFRAELKVAPEDPAANLELGIALVDAQRPEEALPALELAIRSGSPQALSLYYLGRCQRALDRLEEAVRTQQRALELARQQGAGDRLLRLIHNQLATALRTLGREDEAGPHFVEAKRLWALESDAEKKQLDRYLTGQPDPDTGPASVAALVEESPLSGLTATQRVELGRIVRSELARAYLNLGVMQAQAEHFARAVEHLEKAAEIDPDFPRVQYSLGVACFNSRQFDKAVGPLSRALEASPSEPGLRHMLATSLINAGAYERAAALLRDDPERGRDPSLEFAYGLALVRSGRPAEAERVFSSLLVTHGESPELSVMMGQIHAQEGDFEAAVETLKRALEQKPDVAEANATLGVIYLKQGKLPEAEEALRAQLRTDPKDVQSANALATVLDLQGRPQEAIPLLRGALKSKPDFADARYLLGRILLAQGSTAEALEHLEAAVHVAPEDANIHYQLGRAYQALGRTTDAEREFELFRQIKVKSRGTP